MPGCAVARAPSTRLPPITGGLTLYGAAEFAGAAVASAHETATSAATSRRARILARRRAGASDEAASATPAVADS